MDWRCINLIKFKLITMLFGVESFEVQLCLNLCVFKMSIKASHFITQLDKRTGKHKIFIYKNKQTNQQTGEATVTYDDPPSAKAAIDWFNGK